AWMARRWRRTVPVEPVVDPADPAEAAASVGPLTAADVVVRFGGFVALDGAGFRVRPGEIAGLIGPNGAGKTTLFNVVTGIVSGRPGRVMLGERELATEPPHRIARAGLGRTFQNLRLFANLPVRENVELAGVAAATYRGHRVRPDVDG